MPNRLDLPIRDVLCTHDTKAKFRQSALKHDFFASVTLAQIVEAPSQILHEIQLIPGLGVKTLSLLKLVISDEIASLFPAEWRRSSASDVSNDALTQKLSLFRKLFIPAQDIIAFHAEYYSQAFSDANLFVENTVLRDASSDFLYACVSLPEPLKTPALLALETPNHTTANYASRMEELLQISMRRQVKGCILIDSAILHSLATRSGQYRSLSDDDVKHQISILQQIAHLAQPNLNIRVTDYKKHQISTGFLGGDGVLSIYMLGGYLRTEDPSMIRLFRDQVVSASKAGIALDNFLNDLTQN